MSASPTAHLVGTDVQATDGDVSGQGHPAHRGLIFVVALLALVLSTASPAAARPLKKGAKGPRVAFVQRALGLHADRIFGTQTKRAVKRFQRRHGLTADGIVGPATWRALKRSRGAPRGSRVGRGTVRLAAARARHRRRRHLRPRDVARRSSASSAARASPPTASSAPRPGPRSATRDHAGAQAPRAAAAGAPALPIAVRRVIAAGNRIAHKPYKYGGGHGSFSDSGYDCSGSVSYALHGGGLLSVPEDSGELHVLRRARPGPPHHDLREPRPRVHGRPRPPLRHHRRAAARRLRWQWDQRSSAGYTVRHPPGLEHVVARTSELGGGGSKVGRLRPRQPVLTPVSPGCGARYLSISQDHRRLTAYIDARGGASGLSRWKRAADATGSVVRDPAASHGADVRPRARTRARVAVAEDANPPEETMEREKRTLQRAELSPEELAAEVGEALPAEGRDVDVEPVRHRRGHRHGRGRQRWRHRTPLPQPATVATDTAATADEAAGAATPEPVAAPEHGHGGTNPVAVEHASEHSAVAQHAAVQQPAPSEDSAAPATEPSATQTPPTRPEPIATRGDSAGERRPPTRPPRPPRRQSRATPIADPAPTTGDAAAGTVPAAGAVAPAARRRRSARPPRS